MQNVQAQPQDAHGAAAYPKGTRRLHWLPLAASLMLAACASLGSGTPEEQVRQRATERWQALLANDYSKAYTYATPGYRALVSSDNYRSRQGNAVQRLSAAVFSVDCPQADKCNARVEVGARPLLSGRRGPLVTAPVDESWVLEDGQWWLAERL